MGWGRLSTPGVVLTLLLAVAANAAAERVRPAAVAGTWYPGDPQELSRLIDEMLDQAAPPPMPIAGPVRALIVPHAGYAYSGPTAAAAYRLVAGQSPRRVVVLAPAHHGGFEGLSIADVAAYETPLGRIPLDREAIADLRRSPLVVADDEAHRHEHSIEIELPFLQRALEPGWELVPILVGEMATSDYARAGRLIRPLLDGQTLLVISGDFTHYGPPFQYQPFPPDARVRDQLRALDMGAFETLVRHDPEGLSEYRERTGLTACAFGPLMVLANLLPDSAQVALVRYATSGDLSGDYRVSVSYVAAVVTDSEPLAGTGARDPVRDRTQGDPPELPPEQMRILHGIAAAGVEAAAFGRSDGEVGLEAVDRDLPEALRRTAGAFVTLWKAGELRGCVGYVLPRYPLYRAVFENGIHAARDDPRFSPVRPEELSDLEIEVNVLTPPQPIDSVRDFRVGEEGILLQRGRHRAVFLPEVATEQGWDREQTLRHLAVKAGLPPDGWRRDAQFEVFTSQTYRAPFPRAGDRTGPGSLAQRSSSRGISSTRLQGRVR